MTTVSRPNLGQPDQYRIDLDEGMLLWIEEALQRQINELQSRIAEHAYCNLSDSQGCLVRRDWLVREFGSVEAAAEKGFQLTDCSEDLMFYHTELGRMYNFLFESRYVRNNPNSRGMKADAELQSMAHRIAAAAEDTQVLPTVKPETENENNEE